MVQLRKTNRGVKSVDYILPAPTGGLNARDTLGAMQPQYAIRMDNYIPLDNKIALRPGYSLYLRLGEDKKRVETLVSYNKPNEMRMIAIRGGKAWNVSSPATAGKFKDVTFNKSRCQTVQYKNHLYFMNGIDVPKVFSVDDDNVESFTDWGFEAENLIHQRIIAGAVSHEFLWFIERNSMKAWYSAEAGNIAGQLYSFDLSQVSKHGGELVAIANWTVDGGSGIDDFTCFITSEGEVLIYSGYNPNSADNWELKGSYKMSRPIGYQCTMPFQGDIVIISEDGYIPLSKALSSNNAGYSQIAFSDTIRGLVLDRTADNKEKEGWQGIIYSKRGYGIFNVPVSQQFEQHVININTGAWCRFTNIRSFCWCQFNNKMYFGSDDAVYLFDEAYSDNGVQIEGWVEQAYNNFGTDKIKKVQLLNPKTRSSTKYQLTIYTNMDFEERNVRYYANIGTVGQTKWNKAKWSSMANPIGTKWSTMKTTRIRSQWIGNSATGFKASIVFKTKTKGNAIEWYDTGVRYEVGTGIL